MLGDAEECSKFENRSDAVSEDLIQQWKQEQTSLRRKIILHDTEEWQKSRLVFKDAAAIASARSDMKNCLRYLGGLDISFKKKDKLNAACVGLSL